MLLVNSFYIAEPLRFLAVIIYPFVMRAFRVAAGQPILNHEIPFPPTTDMMDLL